MKSLDDVRDIEQQLKNDETFKKQLVRINRNIISSIARPVLTQVLSGRVRCEGNCGAGE